MDQNVQCSINEIRGSRIFASFGMQKSSSSPEPEFARGNENKVDAGVERECGLIRISRIFVSFGMKKSSSCPELEFAGGNDNKVNAGVERECGFVGEKKKSQHDQRNKFPTNISTNSSESEKMKNSRAPSHSRPTQICTQIFCQKCICPRKNMTKFPAFSRLSRVPRVGYLS